MNLSMPGFPVHHQLPEFTQTHVKTRPGADCGSDHELLIAKFRPKLKKAGEKH